MDKEDVVHIYNGILVIGKDEYLPFTSMWMELEGIMLCKISQTEKDYYHMGSLLCGILGTVKRIVGEGKENRMGSHQRGRKTMRDSKL